MKKVPNGITKFGTQTIKHHQSGYFLFRLLSHLYTSQLTDRSSFGCFFFIFFFISNGCNQKHVSLFLSILKLSLSCGHTLHHSFSHIKNTQNHAIFCICINHELNEQIFVIFFVSLKVIDYYFVTRIDHGNKN